VSIAAASARNLYVGGIRMLVTGNVQWQGQNAWGLDENVLCDIQDPFQLDMHRLLMEEEDEVEEL